ncbi:hypothetical protein THTE_3839 [Thermogutta terrifontis]|uniref:Uncharacterized protein n=1 Tax=Thermogutta terrifontis TaxID=1331910 RepID=A0A286RKG1_9BACT|nr:hypothetical protein THTE_3839 [Thermogutta terrifontis]
MKTLSPIILFFQARAQTWAKKAHTSSFLALTPDCRHTKFRLS